MALTSSRLGGRTGSASSSISPGGKRFDFDQIPDIRAGSEDGHGPPGPVSEGPIGNPAKQFILFPLNQTKEQKMHIMNWLPKNSI